MKTICVQVSEEFHKDIKMKALQEDKSIKQYVIELIEKDLKKEKE